jgi:hypothetical protein
MRRACDFKGGRRMKLTSDYFTDEFSSPSESAKIDVLKQ